MRNSEKTLGSGALLALLLTAGCSTTQEPTRVDDDFGNSVRNMIDAQIYNHAAAQNPPVDPPLALDGQKGENVLEAYRKDVAKPKKIEERIQINVSGKGGGR
ncbi:MAG: hypothetical protein U9R74_09350 [Pseudomonadota bacterium]|nr:hypothetical protein [Pseudomonadota bacterium]